MSEFLTSLVAEQVGWAHGRPIWSTARPLIYRSDLLGTDVIIPEEFITDLASVPRWLLTWFLTGGRAPRSAVVHDYACQSAMLPRKRGGVLAVPRRLADRVFRESMAADPISGTGGFTRRLMYVGVRLGAWWPDGERSGRLNPIWTREGWPQQQP